MYLPHKTQGKQREMRYAEHSERSLGITRSIRSKKVLDELFVYLHKVAVELLPKNPLMKALKYTLNQEAEVRRIFESGVYELDNNAIERQIRPVAIGRKNYMFAGSHAGAL